jgi:hypothetical protein
MQVCEALAATGFDVSMTDPGGISMAVGKMSSSVASSGDPLTTLAQQMPAGTPPTSDDAYDGSISQSAAEKVIQQFGGTKNQANHIFAALDTDKNGSIANTELLKAMSEFGSSTASSGMQALEQLLVPYGDSTVTDGEFLSFGSAMVAAEKPAT